MRGGQLLIKVQVSVFSTQPSLAKKTGRHTIPPKGGGGWSREVPKGVTIAADFVLLFRSVSGADLTTGRRIFLW